MKSEKTIQTEVINYLKKLQNKGYPIYFERRQAGGFNYKKGISDLYCIINGKHVEIEIKRDDGKLSVMQEKWRDYCLKNNIEWICIKSVKELKKYFLKIYMVIKRRN